MDYKVFTEKNIKEIPQIKILSPKIVNDMITVAHVLPFRVNNYVLENLINWNNIPEDPIFQLTFPQKEMLDPVDFWLMSKSLSDGSFSSADITSVANRIRMKLNPHPSNQQTENVPIWNGKKLLGMQHKYTQTVLFFPSQGQTCHSYCTFCFRWAQFVGIKELRFSSSNINECIGYIKNNKKITDIIFTGGDPLVAKTKHLIQYLEPLLDQDLEHLKNIRIGTKALTYWPYRFLEEDADDLLQMFKKLKDHGKHVAIMVHCNHWRELETAEAKSAIEKILQTGAMIRSQAPLLAHINDDPNVWSTMWRQHTSLNIVPYYMFIERNTGANRYFEIPLEKCWHIYRDAIKEVSGLSKTVRGPSMSASPGKIEIQGVTEILGKKVFVLRFIQARNPEWLQIPFFAEYDDKVTWLDGLVPAFGDKCFFFDKELICETNLAE